jgi:hypothetical protein
MMGHCRSITAVERDNQACYIEDCPNLSSTGGTLLERLDDFEEKYLIDATHDQGKPMVTSNGHLNMLELKLREAEEFRRGANRMRSEAADKFRSSSITVVDRLSSTENKENRNEYRIAEDKCGDAELRVRKARNDLETFKEFLNVKTYIEKKTSWIIYCADSLKNTSIDEDLHLVDMAQDFFQLINGYPNWGKEMRAFWGSIVDGHIFYMWDESTPDEYWTCITMMIEAIRETHKTMGETLVEVRHGISEVHSIYGNIVSMKSMCVELLNSVKDPETKRSYEMIESLGYQMMDLHECFIVERAARYEVENKLREKLKILYEGFNELRVIFTDLNFISKMCGTMSPLIEAFHTKTFRVKYMDDPYLFEYNDDQMYDWMQEMLSSVSGFQETLYVKARMWSPLPSDVVAIPNEDEEIPVDEKISTPVEIVSSKWNGVGPITFDIDLTDVHSDMLRFLQEENKTKNSPVTGLISLLKSLVKRLEKGDECDNTLVEINTKMLDVITPLLAKYKGLILTHGIVMTTRTVTKSDIPFLNGCNLLVNEVKALDKFPSNMLGSSKESCKNCGLRHTVFFCPSGIDKTACFRCKRSGLSCQFAKDGKCDPHGMADTFAVAFVRQLVSLQMDDPSIAFSTKFVLPPGRNTYYQTFVSAPMRAFKTWSKAEASQKADAEKDLRAKLAVVASHSVVAVFLNAITVNVESAKLVVPSLLNISDVVSELTRHMPVLDRPRPSSYSSAVVPSSTFNLPKTECNHAFVKAFDTAEDDETSADDVLWELTNALHKRNSNYDQSKILLKKPLTTEASSARMH